VFLAFLWLIDENAVDSFNTLLFAQYESASDSFLTVRYCVIGERVRKPAKRTLSPGELAARSRESFRLSVF